ncbi:MAG: S9 family peptidase [Defluviitaleaceae bacterium]|nr:S9 family peptidase [Defluviitaleaceae bacterium]
MEYLKLDDFRNYVFLNRLKYSPSGGSSAVVGSKANDKNGYSKTIYVDKGKGHFPLTSISGSIGPYIWLDDENILFAETRSKNVQDKVEKGYEITSFHRININGGEAVPEFDVDAVVTDLELLPGGAYLMTVLFDNSRPCLKDKSPSEADELLKEFKKEKSYQVIDELPFWFNGRGFINKKRRRLFKYSADIGPEPLTEALDDVESHKLSPCGRYILFVGDKAPFDIHDIKSNLYLIDIANGTTRALLAEKLLISAFDFAGDKILLAATAGEKYSFNEHANFYLLELDGSMKLLLDYDLSIGSSAASDSKFGGGYVDKAHDGGFYFISLDGYYADVYRLCLESGALTNVTKCGGNIDFFDICGSSIIYGAMKGLDLQEVYELHGGVTTKKSSFNDDITANRRLSQPEHHVMTDQHGGKIDGWALKPVDYEPGKPYPAILNIHGGPKVAYGDLFLHEMQYWANHGYFVIYCNPTGSDGKGSAFADIRGKYGTVDYDNLMQFTDEMCRKYPDIDSARIGVTGGSYGGFMTNWIVGHTNRFAAAATQRSICNWISKAYASDIGYYFNTEQMQSDPWRNLEKMWWHSPLKYAPNVTTPTLVLHSDEDYRCWIAEAYQWFTALKLHGVETKLHIFHGENHELSRSGRPDNRVRRLTEITGWMDKYLK